MRNKDWGEGAILSSGENSSLLSHTLLLHENSSRGTTNWFCNSSKLGTKACKLHLDFFCLSAPPLVLRAPLAGGEQPCGCLSHYPLHSQPGSSGIPAIGFTYPTSFLAQLQSCSFSLKKRTQERANACRGSLRQALNQLKSFRILPGWRAIKRASGLILNRGIILTHLYFIYLFYVPPISLCKVPVQIPNWEIGVNRRDLSWFHSRLGIHPPHGFRQSLAIVSQFWQLFARPSPASSLDWKRWLSVAGETRLPSSWYISTQQPHLLSYSVVQ